MKNKDYYITPTRHFIDENGCWRMEFNKDEVIKLMKRYKVKKKKTMTELKKVKH